MVKHGGTSSLDSPSHDEERLTVVEENDSSSQDAASGVGVEASSSTNANSRNGGNNNVVSSSLGLSGAGSVDVSTASSAPPSSTHQPAPSVS